MTAEASFFAPAILEKDPPWSATSVVDRDVPGMITREEGQYYTWIGRAYTGAGEAVELGCWLGCSTWCILDGLRSSGNFSGRRLHVYDDFVWRPDWMSRYYDREDQPDAGGDFQFLFERYTAPLSESLDVRKRSIVPLKDNAAHEPLSWDGRAIEILYVDCGRTYRVNQGWWEALSSAFIPEKTLVIMQDWQLYKQQPPKPNNQTKEFTDSKGSDLALIHELTQGNIGTFVYRG